MNAVIKRKEKSRNQEDFESKSIARGEVPSIQDALSRSVKPVLMTDMENGAERSQVEEENKILEIQDLAVN